MAAREPVIIQECTLRESGQNAAVHETADDLLEIAQLLGSKECFPLIEGPWLTEKEAGDTPEKIAARTVADEFWRRVFTETDLSPERMVAFGSTMPDSECKRWMVRQLETTRPSRMDLLLETGAHNFCIYGKTSLPQVQDVLRVTPQENLNMIQASVNYLGRRMPTREGRLIFDAEHWSTGMIGDERQGIEPSPEYTVECLEAAWLSGAHIVVLCITNGDMTALQFVKALEYRPLRELLERRPWGVHVHNDTDQAEAIVDFAVDAGAVMVHTTFNGLSERCAMARTTSVLPNLRIKMNRAVHGLHGPHTECLTWLTPMAHRIAEIHRVPIDPTAAYVGRHAFTHKAGTHIDGLRKAPHLQMHIDPAWVGNECVELASGMNGAKRVRELLKEHGIDPGERFEELRRIWNEMAARGYVMDQSRHTFIQRALFTLNPGRQPPVQIRRVITHSDSTRRDGGRLRTKEVMADVRCEEMGVDGQGVPDQWRKAFSKSGPVDAICQAVNKIVGHMHGPEVISRVALVDYHVHLVKGGVARGTKANVFVSILCECNGKMIETACVDGNVENASARAYIDAINYALEFCS